MKSSNQRSRNGSGSATETNDRDFRIASRAYAIWEQGGRQDGGALDHWLRAEREISSEDASASRLSSRDSDSSIPANRTATGSRP